MADDKSKKGDGSSKKKGHPFLFGLFLGIVFGIGVGWWFSPKPPQPVEGLRDAAKVKLGDAMNKGRKDVADAAENVSHKLRE